MSSSALPGRGDPSGPRSGARRPLWAGVLADLRARLERGEFDDRFPTDRELTGHYGVSRHTVREAVRQLGRVERRPRIGGRVRPVAGVLQGLGSALVALGARLDLIELGPPSAPDGPRVTYLLVADRQPLLVSQLWPAIGVTLGADEDRALLGLRSDDTGLAVVDEAVLPVVPDPEVHTALMLPSTAAVFRIESGVERTGRPVGRHRAFVRADRYRCAIRFDAAVQVR